MPFATQSRWTRQKEKAMTTQGREIMEWDFVGSGETLTERAASTAVALEALKREWNITPWNESHYVDPATKVTGYHWV